MPVEFRRLSFDLDEVADAALTYCQRAGITIPPRRTPQASVSDDPRARVRLLFAEEHLTGGQLVLLDDRQMQGALVLYCHARRVPLPRGGAKILQAERDALALLIRIEHRDAGQARAAA